MTTFEALVRERRHEAALECLAKIARSLEHGHEFDADDAAIYPRLAAAITTLFADPKLRVSQAGFTELLLRHRVFSAIFAAGGFGNADHLAELMRGKRHGPGSIGWALEPLESLDDRAFSQLGRMSPSAALRIASTLLCQRVVGHEAAEKNRARLIELGPHLAKGTLRNEDVETAVNAWMICSYADLETKHDFKGHLFEVFQRFMGSAKTTTPSIDDSDRPVMAVLCEHFNEGHAMFRCYARSIEQLKRDFHVVLFAEEHRVDACASALVDEVVTIAFDPNTPGALLDTIAARSPSVVYYPSIGMATWTVLASSVRLAPIQIMSLGHPATSRSPVIDYLVTEDDHAGLEGDYVEKLILMERGGHPFVAGDVRSFTPTIRLHADIVRIAVPSNALKLSWSFLAACRDIENAATKPVEFHFFPNLGGVTRHQIEATVANWVSSFVVHPPTDYDTYLACLDRCDLHLSTFPFGGTNSNVDTMRLGIPMVALDGDQSAAAGEVKMLRRMGVADELVAPDVDAYVTRALRLIHDDDHRVQLGRRLIEQDAVAIFCEGQDATNPSEFSDTVKWIFDHHDRLQADERNTWRPADRHEGVHS